MRGRRITAMSMSAALSRREKRSLKLSSSSTSKCRYGTTPKVGIWIISSSILSPGSKILTSPRNLLMIVPLIILFSSSSSSMVPASAANTPPRSMSPTNSTGDRDIFAMPMLTISFSRRLISAGLPAPSMTMISFSWSSRP